MICFLPRTFQNYSPSTVWKKSLYKKMRGWISLPLICFVEIYMQVEIKKLRGPGILKAKKFRCLCRSLFSGTVLYYYCILLVLIIQGKASQGKTLRAADLQWVWLVSSWSIIALALVKGLDFLAFLSPEAKAPVSVNMLGSSGVSYCILHWEIAKKLRDPGMIYWIINCTYVLT